MRPATEYTNINSDTNLPIHNIEERQFQAMATIAVSKKGRIFVSYMGGWHGRPDPNEYITMKFSDDNGKTWSEEFLYVDQINEKYIEVSDPCLWLDHEGKLHLYWTQIDNRGVNDKPLDTDIYGTEHFSKVTCGDWVKHEDGIGCTWEAVCENPDSNNIKFENPRYLFDQGMLNKPLLTKTGRIIYSKYRYDNIIHFDYSDDMGKTFSSIKPIYPKSYEDVEPCLFEKSDGTVVCIWRAFKYLNINYSYDKGESWTPIESTDLQTPFSKPCVIKLPSGVLVMCCNDDPKKRQNLCLYVSEDEGTTWKKRIIDRRYSVAYPDLEYKDGKLYLVYDYNRYTDREICMMIFNENELLTGEIPEIISIVRPKSEVSEEAKKDMANYAQSDDLNDY